MVTLESSRKDSKLIKTLPSLGDPRGVDLQAEKLLLLDWAIRL